MYDEDICEIPVLGLFLDWLWVPLSFCLVSAMSRHWCTFDRDNKAGTATLCEWRKRRGATEATEKTEGGRIRSEKEKLRRNRVWERSVFWVHTEHAIVVTASAAAAFVRLRPRMRRRGVGGGLSVSSTGDTTVASARSQIRPAGIRYNGPADAAAATDAWEYMHTQLQLQVLGGGSATKTFGLLGVSCLHVYFFLQFAEFWDIMFVLNFGRLIPSLQTEGNTGVLSELGWKSEALIRGNDRVWGISGGDSPRLHRLIVCLFVLMSVVSAHWWQIKGCRKLTKPSIWSADIRKTLSASSCPYLSVDGRGFQLHRPTSDKLTSVHMWGKRLGQASTRR